jgi:hypothetical protein
MPQVDAELAELTTQMLAKRSADRPSYDELLDRVGGIVTRLSSARSGGASAAESSVRRASGSASGGRVAPTPFIGGNSPQRFADDEDASPPPLKPQVSRALIAVTVLALMVFVIGLVLFLFGPVPSSARNVNTPHAVDAGAAGTSLPSDAATKLPDPIPPNGMILVKRADNTPWFFVDQKPVSHAEYSVIFRDHKKPGGAQTKAVTGVAFTFARAFATSSAKRLLRADEWEGARATIGFESAGDTLWEWVDDDDAASEQHSVITTGPSGIKKGRRQSRAHGDVTFRMARDL